MNMSGQACATPPGEMAEHHRKCWASDCKRTARLEWCGWRYCMPHFWTYVLAGQSTWGHLWTKIRWTEIIRHYRYDRNERRTVKCLAIIFLPLLVAGIAAWWLS